MRRATSDTAVAPWRSAAALLAFLCLFAFTAARPPAAAAAPAKSKRAEVTKTVANQTGFRPGDKGVAAVVVEIKEGFHAQSRTPLGEQYQSVKFDVKLDPNDAVTFGEVVYPAGHIEEYPGLGRLNVYTGRVVVRIPFEVKADAKPGELKIGGKLRYQLCDDKVCFQPERPAFAIETKIVPAGDKVEANEKELFGEGEEAKPEAAPPSAAVPPPPPNQAPPPPPPTDSSVAAAPAGVSGVSSAGLEGSDWSIGYAMMAAFIAGLLFNVMPCVLPVLPLKAAGFYEAAAHSRGRSVLLGAVFGLGIISIFAVLALFILVFKSFTWGGLFSQGWFVWTIVTLLVVMAFGLFGAFTFRVPVGAYNFQPRHDTVSGNYLLGGLTAVLATPCTAPLLPPLLLWATTQPSVVGVPAFLMVGVGMAFPYLLLSAMPEVAKKFPRTGPWSELFKQMMGFMLLASAAYFAAGRLIHGPEFFWIVVAVVAVGALFLVARTVQLSKNAVPVGISSALAILMLGSVLWWTARTTGLTDRGGAGVAAANTHWVPYSAEGFEDLRRQGKPVLVKFTANWCATCQVIEGTVFRNPAVWDSIASHDVVAMKVDMTEEGAPGTDLLLKLNPAGGIPLTAIFSPKLGQPIVLSSVYQSETLLSAIDRAAPPAPQVASGQ